MDLKNNIEEQKAYLEKNLEQLNTVVSAILGYRTDLFIKEMKQGNKTYLELIDDRNLKDECGIMAKVFSKVTIESFNMWWSENGVCIELVFVYELNKCGSNCVEFCTLNIVNNMVTIV